LIEPTSGRIVFDGRDATAANDAEMRRIRRRIGMVFQHFNLVHRSSVLTNVLAGRLGYVNPVWSLFNRFPASDIEKAHQALARVGLPDKANNRADALSGGQQQRVGIARALMQDPILILADEPVASLDPVLAHSIMQHLERINKDDGVTVLCSLHFLDLVHRYADRVVALNQGRLMFDGHPKEIDDQKFKEIYGKEAERVG
jgi:phosphonate transport system ATP-binding protein